MTTIVTRAAAGAPLSNATVDANFTNLNTAKLELGQAQSSGTANGVLYLNGSKQVASGSALTFDGDGAVVSVNSSSSALRITQTGTGNALVVEDQSGDTTPFVIDATGVVVSGYHTPISVPWDGGLTQYRMNLVGGGAAAGLAIVSSSAGVDGNGPTISMARSLGTVDSPTAIAANDYVMTMIGSGHDGTNYQRAAQIHAAIDGTPSTNSMPGRLVFSTTPAGSSTPTERMRIDSAGSVSIGGPTTVSANSTSNALTITQTGTGNALVVEDQVGDTTPFVIDSSGRVGIGTTLPATNLHISGDGFSGIYSTRYTTGAAGNSFVFQKAYGTTASPAIVGNGATMGRFVFSSYDGADFVNGAEIRADVDDTPSTNDMPGRLVFFTTPSGSATPVERMRIDSAGKVSIGSTGSAGRNLFVATPLTGSTTSVQIAASTTVQSDVTTDARMFATNALTQAASFTLGSLNHYIAIQSTIGIGSTVTNQYGFHANSTLTGATNNYGFYSNIAAGTGRWNFYAAGTAANYFAGDVMIGQNTSTNPGNGNTTTGINFDASFSSFFSRDTLPVAYFNTNTPTTNIVAFHANGVKVAAITGTGGIEIARTAVTAPASSDGNVFSGTYTPTLTNGANVSSSTASSMQYLRVGDVVTVSGFVSVTLTSANVTSVVDISLPIPSALTSSRQVAGTASYQSTTVANNGYGQISAEVTNDRATMRFTSGVAATSLPYSVHFTYLVV